jgi:hypothetical protein
MDKSELFTQRGSPPGGLWCTEEISQAFAEEHWGGGVVSQWRLPSGQSEAPSEIPKQEQELTIEQVPGRKFLVKRVRL